MAFTSAIGALRFLLLLVLFALSAHADSELLSDGVSPPSSPKCQDDPTVLEELVRIRRQFQDLEESSLEKDLVIRDKEKIIIALGMEVENLKKEEILQYDKAIKELGSKVARLEDDFEKAELELQEAKTKAKTLEAAHSLHSSQIKQLEKLVSDQKKQIMKAEQALRSAESTLLRVQAESDAKDKELLKVHSRWLPPWTSIKLVELQASAVEHWTKHGQPLVDMAMKKASERVSGAQKWSKPYVNNFKTVSIGVLDNGLLHFDTAKSKIVKGYEASKDFIAPHLEKVQNVMGPHIQVAKETCGPYVEQAAEIIRPYYKQVIGPYYKQVQSITKPYTDKLTQNYRNFLTSVTTYHSQLQVSMRSKMHEVDFLAPLASNELIWFLSAALLVLPVIFTYTFLSAQLGPRKKPGKAAKGHHHGGHAHKKPKHAKHVDR